MKDTIQKILLAITTFFRNVVLFRGWPFLLAVIAHWIIFNDFPKGFWLGFYIGAAVALSWDEIRQRILHWWKED